jgi:Chitobiase/beta-hexosaminidase C-terminal domain
MQSRGVSKRARRGLALTAVVTLGAGVLATPVNGAVNEPHAVIVSKDDSIVLVDGLDEGEPVAVTVIRDGVTVGVANGAAQDLVPDDGTDVAQFEVNHGPAPNMCWDAPATPQIRAGDEVVVRGGFPTDRVVVSDIAITQGARDDGTGTAFTVKGRVGETPRPPVNDLDVEIRMDDVPGLDGVWRAQASEAGNSIVYDDQVNPAADPESFTATFRTDLDGVLVNPAIIADAFVPGVLDATLTTGVDAAGDINEATVAVRGGPHPPGDPLCPPLVNWTTTALPTRINVANAGGGLTLSGASSMADVVEVTLADVGGSTVGPLDVTPSNGGEPPTSALQTWQTSLAPSQLVDLEGLVTVTARHMRGTAVLATSRATLTRDVIAPAPPTAFPSVGPTFQTTQTVTLQGEGDIVYTLGDGSQTAPARNFGTRYTGPITIGQSAVLKAIAVDGSSNESDVLTSIFTRVAPPGITPPGGTPPGGTPPGGTPGGGGSGAGAGKNAVVPLVPAIADARSGKSGRPKTATARWRAPLPNGAVRDGYEVRALKLRPGRAAKVKPALAMGANATKVKLALSPGRYRFQVRATSAAGDSPWSERSNKVTAR